MRHPLRVVAFCVTTLVLLGGSFVAGTLVKSPNDEALQAAKKSIPVIVTVETRVVDTGFAIPASLAAGESYGVTVTDASVLASATAPTETSDPSKSAASNANGDGAIDAESPSRVVVTATAVSPGDTVGYGRLLGEVSGRPLFSLPAAVPLYRDIPPGATGNDVRALQGALIDLDYYGVTSSGTLDRGTIAALQRLYKKSGYTLPFVVPGIQGVGWREFTGLPTGDGRVTDIAPAGATLTEDRPLLRLQVAPASLRGKITAVQKPLFTSGTSIGVAVDGGAPLKTTVISVGSFTTDEKTGESGYPISVAVPIGAKIGGDAIVELTPVDHPKSSTAVPVIALRQAAGKVTVEKEDRGSPDSESDSSGSSGLGSGSGSMTVPVAVVAQRDGWAAIEADAKLPVGTRLVVEQ